MRSEHKKAAGGRDRLPGTGFGDLESGSGEVFFEALVVFH